MHRLTSCQDEVKAAKTAVKKALQDVKSRKTTRAAELQELESRKATDTHDRARRLAEEHAASAEQLVNETKRRKDIEKEKPEDLPGLAGTMAEILTVTPLDNRSHQ